MSDKGDKSSSSTDSKNTSSTVRFDVGGTVYRVSRSLLAQYPDTMLSRMASEMWQNLGDEQLDEPLFIDRDGEQFRYVLNYMRDGQQVSLPSTISKEGLLKDFEYCGFQNIGEDNIKQPGPTIAQALKTVKVVDDYLFWTATLARYCFERMKFSGDLKCEIANRHKDGEFDSAGLREFNTDVKQSELIDLAESLEKGENDDHRLSFDRSLEPCGLRLNRVENSNCYVVVQKRSRPLYIIYFDTIDGK